MREGALDAVRDRDLRVYFVWMPVLARDDRTSALEHARAELDPRARHYWSAGRAIGKAFGRRVPPRKGPLAWDVVMLFDRGVRWQRGALPRPALVRYPNSMSPPGDPPFAPDELRAAVVRALAAR